MATRPMTRVPAVALADVLTADRPTTSPFIGEAEFVVPSGRAVHLVDADLAFRGPDGRQLKHAQTWSQARSLVRRGWTVTGSVHVRYDTGSGARVPVADLAIAIRSLLAAPIPVRALPGRVVTRRTNRVEAEVLAVRAIGDAQVEVARTDWNRYRSMLGLCVATDAQLADLAGRIEAMKTAITAVQAWWDDVPKLTDVVQQMRRSYAPTADADAHRCVARRATGGT